MSEFAKQMMKFIQPDLMTSGDLMGINLAMNDVTREVMRQKNELFRQVAEGIAGESMKPEMASEFSFIRKMGVDFEILTYRDEVVGALKMSQENRDEGIKITWSFDATIRTF